MLRDLVEQLVFVICVIIVWLVCSALWECFVEAQEGDHIIYLPIIVRDDTTPEVVLSLVNQQRAAHGVPPLALDSRLTTAAYNHSQDMALNEFFSHTGSDGSTLSQRLYRVGYLARAAGECISGGRATAQEVVDGLMESPGHRAILLTARYKHLGVGYYLYENDPGPVYLKHYWTLDLAEPAS